MARSRDDDRDFNYDQGYREAGLLVDGAVKDGVPVKRYWWKVVEDGEDFDDLHRVWYMGLLDGLADREVDVSDMPDTVEGYHKVRLKQQL